MLGPTLFYKRLKCPILGMPGGEGVRVLHICKKNRCLSSYMWHVQSSLDELVLGVELDPRSIFFTTNKDGLRYHIEDLSI